MGPRYSNIGAAQALVRAGAKSLVVASPDTISAYADGGVVKVAQAAGIPSKELPDRLPITDANSTILKLVQAAGPGGGVILDFTPDSAPALMKAAIAQGLVDKVKWGSSTPIAHDFMASDFPEFDGKMFINSEFGLLDASQGPDTRLMLADPEEVRAEHRRPGVRLRWASWTRSSRRQALLNVKGAVTAKSYNEAVQRPEERQDGHALQAVVRRQRAALPHPEQHRHHGRLQERQGRPEGEVLQHRRPSTRSSPRPASGRRSTT